MNFKQKCVLFLVLGAIVILCFVYSDNTTSGGNKQASSKLRKFPNKSNLNLTTRTEIGSVLSEHGFKTMIEIGVRDATYAVDVLQKWPGFEHYYGIDPCEKQANFVDWANKNQSIQDQDNVRVRNMLNKRFGRRKISLIRNYSTKAVGLFEEKSIDLIYIDARHDFCGATEGIEAYYPILKCGGLFSGHDFIYKVVEFKDLGWDVCANGSRIEGSFKRAVTEFAARNNIQQIQTVETTWFFFKKC